MNILKKITIVLSLVLISCNSQESHKEKDMSQNGIIIKESTLSIDETYQKLKNTIENNPNLKVIAELDHQANAARVDKKLLPTRIIMFGNPNLGTPLMQAQQTIGLDLPQKVLVFEDAFGKVSVAYNDPKYLLERHQANEVDAKIIETISGALDKITNVAITK